MEHEKQDRAQQVTAFMHSRRDTRHLGVTSNPAAHTHGPEMTKRSTGPRNTTGEGGKLPRRSTQTDTIHGTQIHSRQMRPGHRRSEVGTASGCWGTGFLCRCDKVLESGGDGRTPSRTDIAKVHSVNV